jgi:selenocysteine lyase/cysteine desulfurase
LPDSLYLDTARLGRISPAALRAHQDSVAFAAEVGASVQFERFLMLGLAAGPQIVGDRYRGLAAWTGVGELKRSLRQLVGHGQDLPVLLANRSAQLMRLAGRLLFHPCRNVLTTDLGWPRYHTVLEGEARRAGRAVTRVAVREDVLAGRIGGDELVERVCREFSRRRCDGLFLTAVSHLGVRLPVERIVRAAEAVGEVAFVVVDGAQDFCHSPGPVRTGYCDLYLAGCHKWLSAHHPMGLGFYGRCRSQTVINIVLKRMIDDGTLDDPLLMFSDQLEKGVTTGTGETVNLAALFTARAAISDLPGSEGAVAQQRNVDAAASTVLAAGWRPLLPDPNLRSGILLIEAERDAVRSGDEHALRMKLGASGVAATTYPGGLVRLSLPTREIGLEGFTRLGEALRLAA